MKKLISILAAVLTLSITASASDKSAENSGYQQNAVITISNRSDYTITVKIMKVGGGHYTTRTIGPKSSSSVSFANSGDFYTKTKAEKGLETLYKKGGSFNVYCESDGYTEGTLEFYVSGYGSSGQTISKAEFEKNY